MTCPVANSSGYVESNALCSLQQKTELPSPFIATYFGIFDDAYQATMNKSDSIPWQYVNRVYIAFATLNEQGELSNLQPDCDEKIKTISRLFREHNPNGELFISSNYAGVMDDRYLLTAKAPQQFAASVLRYLQEYDLDGYDMDWESGMINDYAPQLKSLLQECHDLFQRTTPNSRGNKYKVTHTVWPNIHSPQTVGSLANVVDQINIMCYGWYPPPYSVENFITEYNAQGFPYHKIAIGTDSESGRDSQQNVNDKVALAFKYGLAAIYSWRFENEQRAFDPSTGSIGPSTFCGTTWIHEAVTSQKKSLRSADSEL